MVEINEPDYDYNDYDAFDRSAFRLRLVKGGGCWSYVGRWYLDQLEFFNHVKSSSKKHWISYLNKWKEELEISHLVWMMAANMVQLLYMRQCMPLDFG